MRVQKYTIFKKISVYVHALKTFCEILRMWLGEFKNKSECTQEWDCTRIWMCKGMNLQKMLSVAESCFGMHCGQVKQS